MTLLWLLKSKTSTYLKGVVDKCELDLGERMPNGALDVNPESYMQVIFLDIQNPLDYKTNICNILNSHSDDPQKNHPP